VLFSDDLFSAYAHFMTTLFAMYTTVGADARLRAPIDSRWGDRRKQHWWHEASMVSMFNTDDPASFDDIRAAYDRLSERFRSDLYVTHQALPLLPTQP
jgi:hypothetical protein